MVDTANGTEPSSFRDPSGSVFYRDGRVFRALDERGAEDWKRLSSTRFFGDMVADGRLIGTRDAPREVAEGLPVGSGELTAVVEHDRIPFISYPYEWTFGMLRSAAILQLEVLLAALDEGMTTKDGYAYNIQFRGDAPVFIDIGSFEAADAGGPWVGYRQFCQTMLYPLMVEAYLGIPFQRILRGHLEGIDSSDMRRLVGGSRLLKKGVLRHVVIHDLLASKVETSSQDTRKELASEGAGNDLARATASKLLDLVRSLTSPRAESVWAEYRTTCSYSDEDTEAKTRFVASVVAGVKPSLLFDLGCNDGSFSRLGARDAEQVVSVDFDALAVDNFFRDLRRSPGSGNILPLVLDLTDPSPARGWRGRERTAFFDRGRPDLVLALAVVHHLSIGANIPLAEVVDFLASTGEQLLVEFVEPHDPMARILLSNKPEGTHGDYRTDIFEKLLQERCEVVAAETLPGGSRRLFHAVPRS